MSYKFSTGSTRQGDIYFEDDRQGSPTYIDFGLDTITLRPSGSAILHADEDSVGIGTTTPGATLHVMGGSPTFRVQDSDTNYSFTIDGTVANGIRFHFGDMDGTGEEFMTMGAFQSINRLDTATRDFHLYGTNTTVGFYFDESAGKFGIGTDAPAYTLHAYADVSDEYVAVIDNDAGSNSHGLKVTSDGTGTGTTLLDIEAGSTTVFKVRGDGRVGIGVATPGSTLSVDDEIAVGEKVIHRGDPDTYLQFPGQNQIVLAANSYAFLTYDGNIKINNANRDRDTQIMADDGNVIFHADAGDNRIGIGTQAPGSKLETSGSVGFNVTSFTADASIGETHYTCVANCGSNGANGSVTLTLPAATDAMMGRVYVFKRADTGSGVFGANLVIARNGAYIDGDTDNLQLGNGDCYTIQCIGQASGWIVLGQYVPI